jgi:hypothetical protein
MLNQPRGGLGSEGQQETRLEPESPAMALDGSRSHWLRVLPLTCRVGTARAASPPALALRFINRLRRQAELGIGLV